MTTITASSTIGISLSSPSYANPVAINPGVTISTVPCFAAGTRIRRARLWRGPAQAQAAAVAGSPDVRRGGADPDQVAAERQHDGADRGGHGQLLPYRAAAAALPTAADRATPTKRSRRAAQGGRRCRSMACSGNALCSAQTALAPADAVRASSPRMKSHAGTRSGPGTLARHSGSWPAWQCQGA